MDGIKDYEEQARMELERGHTCPLMGWKGTNRALSYGEGLMVQHCMNMLSPGLVERRMRQIGFSRESAERVMKRQRLKDELDALEKLRSSLRRPIDVIPRWLVEKEIERVRTREARLGEEDLGVATRIIGENLATARASLGEFEKFGDEPGGRTREELEVNVKQNENMLAGLENERRQREREWEAEEVKVEKPLETLRGVPISRETYPIPEWMKPLLESTKTERGELKPVEERGRKGAYAFGVRPLGAQAELTPERLGELYGYYGWHKMGAPMSYRAYAGRATELPSWIEEYQRLSEKLFPTARYIRPAWMPFR